MLVVPARHSASISTKLMQEMGGATVIGPILTGIDKSIQICSTVSTANDILNMAIVAAHKAGADGDRKPRLDQCGPVLLVAASRSAG